jgi:hypothetical protein
MFGWTLLSGAPFAADKRSTVVSAAAPIPVLPHILQYFPALAAELDPDFDAESPLTRSRRHIAATIQPQPPQAERPLDLRQRILRSLLAAEIDPDFDAESPLTQSRRRIAATIQPQSVAVAQTSQALIEYVASNSNPPMGVAQALIEYIAQVVPGGPAPIPLLKYLPLLAAEDERDLDEQYALRLPHVRHGGAWLPGSGRVTLTARPPMARLQNQFDLDSPDDPDVGVPIRLRRLRYATLFPVYPVPPPMARLRGQFDPEGPDDPDAAIPIRLRHRQFATLFPVYPAPSPMARVRLAQQWEEEERPRTLPVHRTTPATSVTVWTNWAVIVIT